MYIILHRFFKYKPWYFDLKFNLARDIDVQSNVCSRDATVGKHKFALWTSRLCCENKHSIFLLFGFTMLRNQVYFKNKVINLSTCVLFMISSIKKRLTS